MGCINSLFKHDKEQKKLKIVPRELQVINVQPESKEVYTIPESSELENKGSINDDENGHETGKLEFFYPIITSGTVVRVVDGDTYHIQAKLENPITDYLFKVRLYGVDCPETRTRDLEEKKKGLVSKEKVNEKIMGKQVHLRYPIQKDKYGRLLAFVTVDGQDLTEWIIQNDLGQSYFGGTKIKKKEDFIMV